VFISLRAAESTEMCHRAEVRGKWFVLVASMALVFAYIISPACAQQRDFTSSSAANLPDAPSATEAASEDPGQNQPAAIAANGASVISGTVLDPNHNVVQGAHVVLSDRAGNERAMESGSNGQFAFSALPPGSYKITITGNGMGKYVSPWVTVSAGDIRLVSGAVLPVAAASTSITVNGDHQEINEALADRQVQIAEEQRVLGVFPNFYSSYDWNAPPMGPRQKFRLAFRSMMDPMAFAGAAGVAGAEQYYHVFPGYGPGVSGYFKRFGAAYTNDFSARMLSSGLFASLFHEDPRYFYKGTGSVQSRTMYAVSCAFVTRNDEGRLRPNYSHVLGVFAAAALSNLYYPKENRGLTLTLANGAIETVGMSGTNIVREFILKGITSHAGGKP
jgi:Carboxypeptidase regulatory-like domain